MKRMLVLAPLFVGVVAVALTAQEPPKPLVSGVEGARSVAVGPGGKVYVTAVGSDKKDPPGSVLVVEGGKTKVFASGMDEPRGIASFQQWLFVADRNRVWRIDARGKAEVFAPATAFPVEPASLRDVVADPESGTVFAADGGDGKGKGSAVYRLTPMKKATGAVEVQVRLVLDQKKMPSLHTPAALAMDGQSHLLLADAGTGELHRIKLADGSTEKVADGLGAPGGLAWDYHGRLFITDTKGGRVLVIPRPGDKPVELAKGFKSPGGLCHAPATKQVLVVDGGAGTLTALPCTVPGAEVDERPLAIQTDVAFPDLQWTGWKPETDKGKRTPLRPIVLTHAGDGSNRVFVATQHGVIHAFPNDQKAKATKVFLDIQDRVQYADQTNEEGFLGLAFHPKYKDNGEFFVFSTPKKAKLTNVVSRFRVKKDDPDRADPDSEEEVLRFTKPYWNHDGGTILFGPDGYLYVTHGDGGSANDPQDNGQNLNSLLGKILRIDIDKKEDGKNYAIPKDNPFVGKKDARPEIWAYGLRNVWRMAFDKKTGQLWAGEVGQNLYEEINLIKKGGNYGWNRRESLHPFGPKGQGPSKDFIEPIWEYHHDVGKSITGGAVYRGTRLPELEGHYVYADYLSTRIWALRYDEAKGRVVANRPIKDRNRAVMSFGEDEKGELYYLFEAPDGKGVHWFVK